MNVFCCAVSFVAGFSLASLIAWWMDNRNY